MPLGDSDRIRPGYRRRELRQQRRARRLAHLDLRQDARKPAKRSSMLRWRIISLAFLLAVSIVLLQRLGAVP